MFAKLDATFNYAVNHSRLFALLDQSAAIAGAELRKLWRDPAELYIRAAQPILWLLVFGQVLERMKAIPTGGIPYTTFLAPGILAQGILFSAIFYGIGVIWERDLGIVHKLLVSPAFRFSLVFGKALAAGLRGLIQSTFIYLLVAVLGIRLNLEPAALLGIMAMAMLSGALFATLSLIVACLVRTKERFMGIGQLLTMPLFFASSAIYPVDVMPSWLRVVALANPLTYLVDALRGLMVHGGQSVHGLGVDMLVLGLTLGLLLAIATKLYPSLVK